MIRADQYTMPQVWPRLRVLVTHSLIPLTAWMSPLWLSPHERVPAAWIPITPVQEALKVEDTSGDAEAVVVPFGTRKLPRAAKVFPYWTYFDKFIYKDWQ